MATTCGVCGSRTSVWVRRSRLVPLVAVLAVTSLLSCSSEPTSGEVTSVEPSGETAPVSEMVEEPEPSAAVTPQPDPEPEIRYGLLGEGKLFETPWQEHRGPATGPSILIEAGIHGDEVAGTLALDGLLPRFRLLSGRVVFLPRMNRPAFESGVRFINEDLNLVFPGAADGQPYERRLAAELLEWVGEIDVDVVVTLHESRYLHDGTNPRTFGQTIVYGLEPMPKLLSRVLDRLNADLAAPRHRFYANYFPISTSSTEVMVEAWKVQGFCAETWRGFELAERVALQEELILAFFDEMGLRYELVPVPEEPTPPPPGSDAVLTP